MVQYSPYAIAEDKTPDWKPGEELAAAAFIGISISLIFDVNVGIWRAFRKSQGLYYWSMKLGTIACLVDAIGVILKYLTPRPYHVWGLYTACLLIGWSVYAPAQLLVLYSRLHLVNDSRKTQRWVLVMIMSTIFFLIIPTWVVVWPAYDPDPKVSSVWSPRDAIVERYNQIGFTLVEVVLSGVYIWSLLGLLNLKSSVRQRRVMLDLVYINVIIVSLDIVVVILLYLNQTGISHPMQNFSYAVKLKLEFVVLNQLMAVAARRARRTNFEERRYHHSSAADAFSAECRNWDRKTPDPASKESRAAEQATQDSSHSDSIQITLPPPTVSRRDQESKDMSGRNEAAVSRPKPYPRISSQARNREEPLYQEKQDGDGIRPNSSFRHDNFLELDDLETDPIRHKPSEAFSGETLRSSEAVSPEGSPQLYPRRVPHATGQMLPSNHNPRMQHAQRHDRPVSSNPNKIPHGARIRRRVPKNGRDIDEEEEEEELGVHMWENRKGSLVMEVPWFKSKVEQ